MLKVLILLTDGEILEATIKIKTEQVSQDPSKFIKTQLIKSLCKNVGSSLKKICCYNVDNNTEFHLFGFIQKGKTGEPNNHVLIPCESNYNNLFGDIILVKRENGKNVNINIQDYTNFYNNNNNDDSDSDENSEDDMDGEIKSLSNTKVSNKKTILEENDEEEEDDDEEDLDELEVEGEDLDELEGEEEEEEEDEDEDEDEDDDEDNEVDENREDEGIKVTISKKGKSEVYIENKKLKVLDSLEEVVNFNDEVNEECDIIIDDDASSLTETDEIKEIRNGCIKLFSTLVGDDSAIKIEESIIKYICKICVNRKILKSWDNNSFKKMYFNKCRSLYSNLKDDSYIKNTELIKKVKNNEISLENIAFMSFQELFPSHWKKIMDEKYKKEKMMYETKVEAMTDQFKCRRCKSRKCTYYELQTRSADEAMTIFITCLNCGNRWKQ
jgi:transcription elongation factor S-II